MLIDHTRRVLRATAWSDVWAGDTLHSSLVGVYDMRDDWVQTLRDQGLVRVRYVKGQANKANVLTKCLSSGAFNSGVRVVADG